MTPNETRAAVAKLQGIEKIEKDWWGWSFAGIEMPGDMPAYLKVPDYLSDRNAMAQVLRSLDDEEWLEFMLNLCALLNQQPDFGKWTLARAMLESSPTMQAYAYLETKHAYENPKD